MAGLVGPLSLVLIRRSPTCRRSGRGTRPYLRRLDERGCSGDEPPQVLLRQVVVDVAAELYRDQAAPPVELLEFSDGAFDVLFDAAHELTILIHGLSQSALPNSRDRNYHRGFPSRPGFGKGHAMSHAQGGCEGGPNYFPQAPRVNRRLSPLGALWLDSRPADRARGSTSNRSVHR